MTEKVNYATAIPPEIFNYRKSPKHYFSKCIAHSAAGLILGVSIDKICNKIQQGYNLRPSAMIFIQLLVIFIVFYIIEMYISKDYKWISEWQNISAGLIFAGLFFSSQSNLFNNVKKFVAPL